MYLAILLLVFKKKYLILELDAFEAEFYHLPQFVPYFEKDQKKLDTHGFDWNSCVEAMKYLLEEDSCDEYRLYKLFVKKWDYYKKLTSYIDSKNYTEAQKIVNQILSVDILDPSVYLNLGNIYFCQSQFLKAQQAYLKGLEIVDFKTPFLAGLAKTYEAIGHYDDAMFYWFEVFNWSLAHKEIEELDLLNQVFEDSISSLLRLKVFDKLVEDSEQVAQQDPLVIPDAIPRSLVKLDQDYGAEFVPGHNFLRMMRRSFTMNYNQQQKLNSLGVKLVHHKFTDFAVKVFERVYELSHFKQNQELVLN